MQNLILLLGATGNPEKSHGHTRADRTKFCLAPFSTRGDCVFTSHSPRARARLGG